MSISKYSLLIFWLWSCCFVFSSEPNLQDCVESIHLNEITNNSVVYVPQGTVCFNCSIVAFGNYNFSINGTAIPNIKVPAKVVTMMNSLGREIDALVVSSARVFNYYFTTTIQCHNPKDKSIYQNEILLQDLNHPLIKRESTNITDSITIIEGSTLDLRCDGSNSIPQPSLKWISPDGSVISETGHLEIEDITNDKAGEYTCIATIPETNITMNTTLTLTALVMCNKLDSTEMVTITSSSNIEGSTATYQCKEGPTDVHTTQCASNRSWVPDPFSSINCTSDTKPPPSEVSEDINLIAIIAPIIAIILCVVCITVVVVIVCLVRKKRSKTDGVKQDNTRGGGGEYRITFSEHSSYNEEQTAKPEDLTTPSSYPGADIGGIELYSVPRSVPFMTEDDKTVINPEYDALPPISAGNYSYSTIPEVDSHQPVTKEIHPAVDTRITHDNIPYGHETRPLAAAMATEYHGQFQETELMKPVQILPIEPEVGGYEPAQFDQNTRGPVRVMPQDPYVGAIPLPKTQPLKPPRIDEGETFGMHRTSEEPRVSAPKPPADDLDVDLEVKKYVQVGICPQPTKQPEPDKHTVQYAILDHQATADSSVNRDNILNQLRYVVPDWKKLGAVTGIENLDEISRRVNNSDEDAMTEVVERWLAKLPPQQHTWNEVAHTVERIGYGYLANSLRKVYTSGQLPIQISQGEYPPPVPPHKTKKANGDGTIPHL